MLDEATRPQTSHFNVGRAPWSGQIKSAIGLVARQVLILGVAELVRVLRFLKSHDFSYPQIKNGQGTSAFRLID